MIQSVENNGELFKQMQKDRRIIHRRNYLIKKNGGIKSQRRFLELSPYEYILKKQGGVCAICKCVDKSGRSLAIDHNHNTNAVRGLLCGSCNRGLGLFKDDVKILSEAIKYLKNDEKNVQ